MNGYAFTLAGAALTALPSGALWWAAEGLLAVSDLHLGRSDRSARRGGALLPPYEVEDTLARLDADIAAARPACVLCLGDSFDDDAAAQGLEEAHLLWLARLQAGRRWLWVAGNHDPAPIGLGGSHLAEARLGPLSFRHEAQAGAAGEVSGEVWGEVSGHFHPKATVGGRSRPCFLVDGARLILPAYGTYTGGLRCDAPVLAALMGPGALALLTGPKITPVPMPRPRRASGGWRRLGG
jgi:hypothetical protein